MPEQVGSNHVIVLVHGIRDFALWQNSIRSTLERHDLKVESTNYGRLNLLQFLVPFEHFRERAISEVWNQIRIVKQNYPGARISVIAHSFGTYVISHLVQQNFDIRFESIIFCGSVVQYDFPFEQFQDRFAAPIVNEVGTQDVWPAIAESVTRGYGSAGTYGFRRPLVRDRWHNGARHGFFLTPTFCETFWVPFLKDRKIVEAAETPESPLFWVKLLTIAKVKYLLAAIVLALFAVLSWQDGPILAEKFNQWFSATHINVPDPRVAKSTDDFEADLKVIETEKRRMPPEKIKNVSDKLTAMLLTTSDPIPREERRDMNGYIVQTLGLLNDGNLSFVWKALPRDVDLSYVDFSGMELRGIKFDGTFAIHSDFSDADLSDSVFEDAHVRNSDFSGAMMSETKFIKTDWFNALNLAGDLKNGVPTSFSTWTKCPSGYDSGGTPVFAATFDRWYVTHFNQLKSDEAQKLIDGWNRYSARSGLCDKVMEK
jgi:hypothetical protein